MDQTRTNRSRTNEIVGHALLALGIILLLFLSILIAWIIVCCERRRRKHKFRPGQQNRRTDPMTLGSVMRSGPSPIINRHLLVHKPSQNLVIANKAFLSKSTPYLVQDDDAWRFEGLGVSSTPAPSEPLLPPVASTSGGGSRRVLQHRDFNHRTYSNKSVPRTWSEPQLPVRDEEGSLQGSFQELSIHDQILKILGTFPHLDFLSLSPSKKSNSSLLNDKGVAVADEGPESLVDDEEVAPPPLPNGFKYRPTTLLFDPPSPILPYKISSHYFLSPQKKKKERDVEAQDSESSALMETTI